MYRILVLSLSLFFTFQSYSHACGKSLFWWRKPLPDSINDPIEERRIERDRRDRAYTERMKSLDERHSEFRSYWAGVRASLERLNAEKPTSSYTAGGYPKDLIEGIADTMPSQLGARSSRTKEQDSLSSGEIFYPALGDSGNSPSSGGHYLDLGDLVSSSDAKPLYPDLSDLMNFTPSAPPLAEEEMSEYVSSNVSESRNQAPGSFEIVETYGTADSVLQSLGIKRSRFISRLNSEIEGSPSLRNDLRNDVVNFVLNNESFLKHSGVSSRQKDQMVSNLMKSKYDDRNLDAFTEYVTEELSHSDSPLTFYHDGKKGAQGSLIAAARLFGVNLRIWRLKQSGYKQGLEKLVEFSHGSRLDDFHDLLKTDSGNFSRIIFR